VIPAGTYVQGRISSVKRGGHIKGRAEVLMHFSTLIIPAVIRWCCPEPSRMSPELKKPR
jgi:hypothetical protein